MDYPKGFLGGPVIMANEEFDPFNTDDSNDIAEYTGIVKTSVFDTNDKYDSEALLMMWEVEITGPEDFPFPTRQVSFTCGKKFESPDGGKSAVHESGKPKGFNSSSRIGMLIDRAFYEEDSGRPAPTEGGEKDGEEVESFGLRDWFLGNDYTPFMAEPWIGFEFAFHAETHDWGGDIGIKHFEMPHKIIAMPGESKAATKKTPAKKAPAKKGGTRKRAAVKEEKPEEPEVQPIQYNWGEIKEAILDVAGTEGFDSHVQFVAIGAGHLASLGITEETEGVDDVLAWMDDEAAINAEFE
jgi:hypothetical protein